MLQTRFGELGGDGVRQVQRREEQEADKLSGVTALARRSETGVNTKNGTLCTGSQRRIIFSRRGSITAALSDPLPQDYAPAG